MAGRVRRRRRRRRPGHVGTAGLGAAPRAHGGRYLSARWRPAGTFTAMYRSRWATVTLLGALVLAGCSQGGPTPKATPGGTTGSDTASSPATGSAAAADQGCTGGLKGTEPGVVRITCDGTATIRIQAAGTGVRLDRAAGPLGAFDPPPGQVRGDELGRVEALRVLRAAGAVAQVRHVVPDHEQGAARCHRPGGGAQYRRGVLGWQVQVGDQYHVEGGGRRPVPPDDVRDHPLHPQALLVSPRPALGDRDGGEVHRRRLPAPGGQPERVAALSGGEVEH